ncbi:MAG: RES domain-containing protein [Gammaproteobacteria bacterium]|nr:RES domain-containing protein [Gammaproteobacteria bacterium]
MPAARCWRRSDGDVVDYTETRLLGDRWYDQQEATMLWVPSVVSGFECSVLINQRHPDLRPIRAGRPRPAHSICDCHAEIGISRVEDSGDRGFLDLDGIESSPAHAWNRFLRSDEKVG